MFNFELTTTQEEHLKAVKWLLDCNCFRASGRSYLMAVVFIDMAMRYPGQKICIYDHFPAVQAKERILRLIKNIITSELKALPEETEKQRKEKAEILQRFKFYCDGFMYDGPRWTIKRSLLISQKFPAEFIGNN